MRLSDLDKEIVDVVSGEPQGCATRKLCARLNKTPQELGDSLERLKASQGLFGFAGLWLSPPALSQLEERLLQAIRQRHADRPQERTILGEQVASDVGLKWPAKSLDRLWNHMAGEGKIAFFPPNVRAPEFKADLPPRQAQFLDRVVAELEKRPIDTPNPHRISETLRIPIQAVEEILAIGVESGRVVQIDEQVFYTPAQLGALEERLSALARSGPLSASRVRDELKTTRKYALALLARFHPRLD
jgi:hypothetical protein